MNFHTDVEGAGGFEETPVCRRRSASRGGIVTTTNSFSLASCHDPFSKKLGWRGAAGGRVRVVQNHSVPCGENVIGIASRFAQEMVLGEQRQFVNVAARSICVWSPRDGR